MQTQRRSRFVSILKKVALAVVVKKAITRFQAVHRPPKRSWASRMAKLGVLTAVGAGMFYAFLSGKLQPVVARAMGSSPQEGSGGMSWQAQGPAPTGAGQNQNPMPSTPGTTQSSPGTS